jgi:hypothetical protein
MTEQFLAFLITLSKRRLWDTSGIFWHSISRTEPQADAKNYSRVSGWQKRDCPLGLVLRQDRGAQSYENKGPIGDPVSTSLESFGGKPVCKRISPTSNNVCIMVDIISGVEMGVVPGTSALGAD